MTVDSVPAKTAKVANPASPLRVMATRNGTYPKRGETYPVYRTKGDVFWLNNPDHYSREWMRKLAPDEAAPEIEAEPVVPQTSAPTAKRGRQFAPLPEKHLPTLE